MPIVSLDDLNFSELAQTFKFLLNKLRETSMRSLRIVTANAALQCSIFMIATNIELLLFL